MTAGQFSQVNWDDVKGAAEFVLKGAARRVDGDDWAVYQVTTKTSNRLVIDIKFDVQNPEGPAQEVE